MRVPQVNERVKEAPAHALRAMFAGIGQMLSITDKLRGKPAEAPEPPAEASEPSAEASETTATDTVTEVATETAARETVTVVAAPNATVTEVTVTEAVADDAAEPAAVAADPAPAAKAKAAAKPRTAAKPRAAAKPKAPASAPEAPATAGGHVRLLPSDEVAAATTAEPAAAAPEPAAAAPSAAATVAPTAAPSAAAATAPTAELPLANYDELTIASLRARLRNLSADQLAQLIDYEKGHAARADVITMFERRIAKLAEG